MLVITSIENANFLGVTLENSTFKLPVASAKIITAAFAIFRIYPIFLTEDADKPFVSYPTEFNPKTHVQINIGCIRGNDLAHYFFPLTSNKLVWSGECLLVFTNRLVTDHISATPGFNSLDSYCSKPTSFSLLTILGKRYAITLVDAPADIPTLGLVAQWIVKQGINCVVVQTCNFPY